MRAGRVVPAEAARDRARAAPGRHARLPSTRRGPAAVASCETAAVARSGVVRVIRAAAAAARLVPAAPSCPAAPLRSEGVAREPAAPALWLLARRRRAAWQRASRPADCAGGARAAAQRRQHPVCPSVGTQVAAQRRWHPPPLPPASADRPRRTEAKAGRHAGACARTHFRDEGRRDAAGRSSAPWRAQYRRRSGRQAS